MKNTSPIAALFFTIMLDLLGVNILIPILPQLFANPASPHYLLGADLNIHHGYYLLGLLMATYTIGQFFTAPIFGQLSDKLGRKPVLIWSILASGLGYVLLALGVSLKSISLLFFARALTGITSGNVAVAQAAMGDLSDSTNRARNFGLIGAAFGVGLILGPFVGGVLASNHYVSWFSAATPFWFAALITLFNAFFVLTMLKETHTQKNPDLSIAFNKAIHKIFHAWSLVDLRPLFITNFLYMSGFIFFTAFVSVYLVYHFQYSESQIGNYFAFLGFCIVLTQGLLTRILSKFVKEENVLKYSLALTSLTVIAFLLSKSSQDLYLAAPFFAIAIGLSMANITALISKRAGVERQGETMGLNSSVMALSGILPQLTSGYIAGIFSPDMPLIFSSLLILISGLYFVFYANKN